MSTKYRDRYKAMVKGAVPVTEEEEALFKLAMEEERREEIAEDIAHAVLEKLDQRDRKVGAPRKTGGDIELVDRLMAKHQGNTKLVRREFSKVVCDQDNVQKKRAGERFRTAFKTWQGLKT